MWLTRFTSHQSLKRKLPPSRRLPVSYQTICCRWLPVRYIEDCHAHLGERFTIYTIDMPPLVFLTAPDDIRAVLAGDPSRLHPGAGSAIIEPLIGPRSFMLLEEDDHICGRRSIKPAFHQRMTAHHAGLLSEAVEREVASWPLDKPIQLDPLIRSLTLHVILRAIFGGDDDSTLAELHMKLVEMLSVTTSVVLQEPKMRHLPGWRRSWSTFLNQRAEVDHLIYTLMRRRESGVNKEAVDLLDMLLAADDASGKKMADRDIRDNLMSMILAGHETTTGELSWAFQLLAHHPCVQAQLVSELDKGRDDAYLEATINETMRRKPVFLFAIPRKVIEPVQVGDWIYEPPAHLVGCTYLMHHNPELYRRPYEFRPERFLDEPPASRTWLPWGGGRKHCLGRHFALLEVKTVLRHILARRAVLPASERIEHARWRSAILVPHAGGRVILKDRAATAGRLRLRSSGS
jgi:cytochrome P450